MNHNTVYLSSCKVYDYEALRAIIDEQFEALGFAEKIKPGMKVAVKPNLVVRAKEESGTCTLLKEKNPDGAGCRHFAYDPLRRTPKGTPRLRDYDPEDFVL